MAIVQWVLLESFAALGTALGLIVFALLVHWRRGHSARPLLIGLAISAALITVQAAVTTDRERAGVILKAIETDLLGSRVDALKAALSTNFHAEGMNADDLLDRTRRALQRIRIARVWRTDLRVVASTAEGFVAEAAYIADLRSESRGGGTLRSRWRIEFAREPGAVRIRAVIPTHLHGAEVRGWSDLNDR